MKKTDEELYDLILAADFEVPVGGTYVHRKTGNEYICMGLCLRESDLMPMVVYRRDMRQTNFCRPLDEFKQRFTVKSVPGGRIKERF